MEARILTQYGKLGKRIYKADVPYDLEVIQKRIKKTLLGAGKWRNTNDAFFMVIPQELYIPYFSVKLLKEILVWMKSVKEED